MIRLLEATSRGGSQADTVSIIRKPIVTERPTCAERILTNRLFAGGAHIHVDFHAARHFDDLRGFPGHFGSPFREFGRVRPLAKLLRAQKFASEIFPRTAMLRCGKHDGNTISADIALPWAHSVANPVLIKQL
jgi:hypothetical protein